MASQHFLHPRALSSTAQRAEELLVRYPDLSDEELAGMIETFTSLPLLDFGLMVADEHLGDKLGTFYRDHGDQLRPPTSGAMWAMSLAAGVAMTGWLIWAVS